MTIDDIPAIYHLGERLFTARIASNAHRTWDEYEVVGFRYSYLIRHGLPVVRQAVDEDRHNLIVELDEVEAELVLVRHLDTVEAYDLESYEYSLDGDTAAGLGTADMKGGCAAMIEAFLTLWENGHTNRPVALAQLKLAAQIYMNLILDCAKEG